MAQVQAVAGDTGTGAATLPLTISSSVAGNTLLAFGLFNGDAVTSVTDNLGQTWTLAFTPSSTFKKSCYYKTDTAAGVTTITFNISPSIAFIGFVTERDDIALTSPFDAQNGATQTSVTSWASATASNTQASAIAFGLASSGTGSNQSFAPTGSWADITGTGITNGHHGDTADGDDGYMQTQVLSSIQALAATGTCVLSSVLSTVILFKAKLAAAKNLLTLGAG